MSYGQRYSGSPWQHGGPVFGMNNFGGRNNYGPPFNQGYGGPMGGGMMDNHVPMGRNMMNNNFGRNQGFGGGGGGGMFSGPMDGPGRMGYGPSRPFNDRMKGPQQRNRNQMGGNKRPPPGGNFGGPRNKRPNMGGPANQRRNRTKQQQQRRKDKKGVRPLGKGDKKKGGESGGEEPYNPAEPTQDASDQEEDGASTDGMMPSTEKNGSGESPPKTSSSLQMQKARDRPGRKRVNWCTVCENKFDGGFLAHRRTKDHRRNRDRKYPKCRLCKLGFSSPDEYKDHCNTEEHKKKAAQYQATKGVEADEDKNRKKLPGERFLVSVRGYFCKLCDVFIRDTSLAGRTTHCNSEQHLELYEPHRADEPPEEEEEDDAEKDASKGDKEEVATDGVAEDAATSDATKEKEEPDAANSNDVSTTVKQEKADTAASETTNSNSLPAAPVKEETKDCPENKELSPANENNAKEEPGSDDKVADDDMQAKSQEEDEGDGEEEEADNLVSSSPSDSGRGRGRGGRARGRGRSRSKRRV